MRAVAILRFSRTEGPAYFADWLDAHEIPWQLVAVDDFKAAEFLLDGRDLGATLKKDGVTVFKSIIGVGRSYWPTPAGEYYIRDKLAGFDNPALVDVAERPVLIARAADGRDRGDPGAERPADDHKRHNCKSNDEVHPLPHDVVLLERVGRARQTHYRRPRSEPRRGTV